MNWAEIKEQWPHVRWQAQLKWAKLSDADLTLVGGNRDRLIGKLELRYGLAKEFGGHHVDEWSSFEAIPEQG